MTQPSLFGHAPLPSSINGLAYAPEFLSTDEERELLCTLRSLPLEAARYKQYQARRRVLSFGGSYDFDANRLLPSLELDPRLHALRERAACWLGVPARELVHTLVAEYAPGTPLGWHRDVPEFEAIVGVSLGGPAVLRFRPYPPGPLGPGKVVQLEVAPRSIYRLSSEARWGWQHCVLPTREHRWSITFRTPRHAQRG